MADPEYSRAERERFALEDWDDLMRAEVCISFTEPPRKPSTSRGGRHVEYGAALAAGLYCFVIGPQENVFHCMPGIPIYPDWQSFIEATRGLSELVAD